MKVLFVPARAKLDVKLPASALRQLKPIPYGVVTTVQHVHMIRQVCKQLPRSICLGTITGCMAEAVRKAVPKVDAFLFVGTGQFHPLRLALDAGGKPVYVYNPLSGKLELLNPDVVEHYRKRIRGRVLRFLHAKTVGLIVTTKPGQNDGHITKYSRKAKMQLATEFMKRTDKKYYLFAADTLQHNALEDFGFIDCWVNFACNRIVDDENNSMVNIQDVLEYEASSRD